MNKSRFIPTCVGNITAQQSIPSLLPVHPHMRGEHAFTLAASSGLTGSSPHAWGTSILTEPFGIGQRFIPTCVGNIKKP